MSESGRKWYDGSVFKGLMATGWLGVAALTGALIALYSTQYRLAHYRLEDQIKALDDQWGVVCIARGERMECQIQRMPAVGT